MKKNENFFFSNIEWGGASGNEVIKTKLDGEVEWRASGNEIFLPNFYIIFNYDNKHYNIISTHTKK